MPSGPHANLNIHGKDPANFICPEKITINGIKGYWKPILDDEGNFTGEYKLDTSIFIPEYTSVPLFVKMNRASLYHRQVQRNLGKKEGTTEKEL